MYVTDISPAGTAGSEIAATRLASGAIADALDRVDDMSGCIVKVRPQTELPRL
jgi:hypothetical protein